MEDDNFVNTILVPHYVHASEMYGYFKQNYSWIFFYLQYYNIQNLKGHLAELMAHPLRFTALKERRKLRDV